MSKKTKAKFPFSLQTGPEETPELGWVRRHSSYLTVGGFWNTLTLIGIFARGIALNLVVATPVLILAAIFLALIHHWVLRHPFWWSYLVLGAYLIFILGFVLVSSIRHCRQSDDEERRWLLSSPLARLRLERWSGWIVAGVGIALFCEISPRLIEYARANSHLLDLSWGQLAGICIGASAAISSLAKSMDFVGQFRRQIVVVVLGVISLLLPWLLILRVTDFLVYGVPPSGWRLWIAPAISLITLLMVIGISLLLIYRKDVNGTGKILLAATFILAVTAYASVLTARMTRNATNRAAEYMGVLTRPLSRLAKSQSDLEKLSRDAEKRLKTFSVMKRRLDTMANQRNWDSLNEKRVFNPTIPYVTPWFAIGSDEGTPIDRDYYQRASYLLETGERIGALNDLELFGLKDALSRQSYKQIEDLSAKKKADASTSDAKADKPKAPKESETVNQSPQESDSKLQTQTNNTKQHPATPSQKVSPKSLISTTPRPSQEDKPRPRQTQDPDGKDLADEQEAERSTKSDSENSGANQQSQQTPAAQTQADDSTPTEELNSREMLVLRGLVALDMARKIKNLPHTALLQDANEYLSTHYPIEDLKKNVLERRVAKRMEPLYLDFVGQQPLSKDSDGTKDGDEATSAPDAARSGVLYFRRSIHQSVKSILPRLRAEVFWELSFPRLTLIDLNDQNLKSQFEELISKTLNAKDGENLGDAKEIKVEDKDSKELREFAAKLWRRCDQLRTMTQFSPLELCRIIDSDGYVYSTVDSPVFQPMEFEVENRVRKSQMAALKRLLKEQWSTQNAEKVQSQLDKFAPQFQFTDGEEVRLQATEQLLRYSLVGDDHLSFVATDLLGELYNPSTPQKSQVDTSQEEDLLMKIFRRKSGDIFTHGTLETILASRFTLPSTTDRLASRLEIGPYGNLQELTLLSDHLFRYSFYPKLFFAISLAITIAIFCFLFVDINATSGHGFYRDRLARTFIFERQKGKVVQPSEDIPLSRLAAYSNGSIAPYHLINTTLNLQGSEDLELRDRKSDFFLISKLFIGSERTKFIETALMEQTCPQLSLSSAVAISAGAASPNSGRLTPINVFLLTLMNLRLGYWLPNPTGLSNYWQVDAYSSPNTHLYGFFEVYKRELAEIEARRTNLPSGSRPYDVDKDQGPDTRFHLVGLALSGGGIRSAALNLGICQVLDQIGLFQDFDYLSSVSGGGYLGASISNSMRSTKAKTKPNSPSPQSPRAGWWYSYRWRIRPHWFFKEMSSNLKEDDDWVNLSDGGHIENLGIFELLKRRCELIVVGDAEADPEMRFPSLAVLLRYARVVLGVEIQWADIGNQFVGKKDGEVHFAVGKILYPPISPGQQGQTGYMLYLKSSLSGDEELLIQQYAKQHPSFPHQSTADQFFDDSQFEAYRSLGQHIASHAFSKLSLTGAEIRAADLFNALAQQSF